MSDFFEKMEESAESRPKAPIWTIDLDNPDNERKALDWLNGEYNYLIEKNRYRHEQIKKNLALFKGIQYQTQETRTDARDRNEDRSRAVQKVVVNNLADFVQYKVSRQIKYKPAVAILPANDEFSDEVSAKMNGYLLDHIWYTQNFENDVTPKQCRFAYIGGESFLFIEWDPEIGDLHPDYIKLREQNKGQPIKIPLQDEKGEQLKNEFGDPIFIEKEIHIGDVKYSIEFPTHVLLEKNPGINTWDKVNYLYREEILHVEEAKMRWPKSASKIRADATVQNYNIETMETETYNNHVKIQHFYHKFHKMMPRGRMISYVKDAILANKELPYSHGKLPCVRLTDLDIPEELNGVSFFNNTRGLAGAYNNLTNMILRNMVMVGHPKWMLPAGAAKIDQLGNDITIVQYKGPVAPQLVSAQNTSADVFNFRKELKEENQQLAGVFGISRGEPPPGINAGVALQFLSEQEQERGNEDVMKFNEYIRQTAIMTLSVSGDYYDKSDDRTFRVIGKNNEWMTVFFEAANLSKDYDVRIQNTSALPQSKAARTQYLFDLAEKFPDQVSGEQVLDLLDMSQSEKFIDIATESVRTAEAENESMLQGRETLEPEKYENHITHWKTHVRLTQSYKYKRLPPEIREECESHIMVHEMFMWDQQKINPAFAEQLMTLSLYPLFYEPDVLPPMPPPMEPMEPQVPGALSEGLPQDQQLPVQGAGEQELVNQPPLDIEQQTQGGQPLPAPGPVEPTGAI